MTYQNRDADTLPEVAGHLQNDARTCNQIGTRLTQRRSADVPDGLVQMRRRHGFDSPIGRRCSNILEMLDAGTAKPADIAEQVAELAALTK